MSTDETKTRVVILTQSYRITGLIDLVPGARVTDFLHEARAFIAVTQAEVWETGGRKVLAAPFVNISRDHIQVVIPEE